MTKKSAFVRLTLCHQVYGYQKLFIIALLFILTTGCTTKNPDGSYKLTTNNPNNPTVIVIDSCEYIRWQFGLAHKGNCKFCEQRKQKELNDILKKLNDNHTIY